MQALRWECMPYSAIGRNSLNLCLLSYDKFHAPIKPLLDLYPYLYQLSLVPKLFCLGAARSVPLIPSVDFNKTPHYL